MGIRLSKDVEQRLLESIKRFWSEELDEEIGDLRAALVLDYFLREPGPVVYNLAVEDARGWIQDRLADLDGSVHAPEAPRRKT